MEASWGSLRTNPFKASAIAPWSDLSLASKIGVSSAALIWSRIDLLSFLVFDDTSLLVGVDTSSSFSSLAALNAVILVRCASMLITWRGDRCVCGAAGGGRPVAKPTSGVNAVAWLLITASTSTATHPTRNNCCLSFGIISLLCFHFLVACACEPADANTIAKGGCWEEVVTFRNATYFYLANRWW